MQFLLQLQSEAAQGGQAPPEVLVEGGEDGGVVHTLLVEPWVAD